MKLILVRHGIAENADLVEFDKDRRLTEEGREKTFRMAKALCRQKEKIKKIY